MISRKQILSRNENLSKSDAIPFYDEDDDDNVWYLKDKLFKDHIQEILNKWEQIDDEIWAKIICMEVNRRVAKAYIRAPVVTINGSCIGFDGYRVGVKGFENPKREPKTREAQDIIGEGIKIKMDDSGNILIKKIGSKCNIQVKPWTMAVNSSHNNSIGKEILQLNGRLEVDKPFLLFDMKRFYFNIGQELKGAYPDRKNLESQCITCICFGNTKDMSSDLLETPSWIMIINIVALELVKSRVPPIRQRIPKFVSIFDPKNEAKHSRLSTTPERLSTETDKPRRATDDEKGKNQVCLNGNENNAKHLQQHINQQSSNQKTSLSFDEEGHKVSTRKLMIPEPDYDGKQVADRRILNHIIKDDPYYCGFTAKVTRFEKKPVRVEKAPLGDSKLNQMTDFKPEQQQQQHQQHQQNNNHNNSNNGNSSNNNNNQSKISSYLNHAIRKLPLHHQRSRKVSSSRQQQDPYSVTSSGSEGPYYHVYSSIPETGPSNGKLTKQRSEEFIVPPKSRFRRIKRHSKDWN